MNELSDISLDSSALLNSFSKYSSDGLDTSKEGVKVRSGPLNVAINNLLDFKAKHKITLKGTADLAILWNEQPNAHVNLPARRDQIKSSANLRFDREFVLICKCNNLCDENGSCSECKKQNKKGKSNFIVKIPIKQQIKELLSENLVEIIRYMKRDRKTDVISDIDDGALFKTLSKENPNTMILSFTINSDGAPLYKSSKLSMWPVQLIANFLPPDIRYKKQNVLVHTLYISKVKPEFNQLFSPLAQEIDTLQKDTLSFLYDNTQYKCIPVVMLGAFDLPARAMASGQKLYSGDKACVFCMHSGVQIKDHLGQNYIRYVNVDPNPMKRTHEGVISTIDKLNSNSTANAYGIVNIPPMLLFPKFDLGNGYIVDYMHNAVLNVCKLLIDFWMGSHRLSKKSKHFAPLLPTSRNLLNKRLTSLKPCSYISRKPRSLEERSYFKASEYRCLLLFYLRYALRGLLDHNRVKHFELLSAGIYILLKSEISEHEIREAGIMLKQFTVDFEKLYGKEAVTMNVHLLNHCADSVIQCGPLWSYSMFSFEKNIGILKKSVMNQTDSLDTISFHYCMVQKDLHIKDNETKLTNKSKLKEQQISSNEKETLIERLGNANFEYSHTCMVNNHKYKSTMSPATKSIDHFLKIKNCGAIACAKFYVKANDNIYVLVQLYNIREKSYHLSRIESSDQFELYAVTQIECKLIYMKFGCFEIVAAEPNRYENSS